MCCQACPSGCKNTNLVTACTVDAPHGVLLVGLGEVMERFHFFPQPIALHGSQCLPPPPKKAVELGFLCRTVPCGNTDMLMHPQVVC